MKTLRITFDEYPDDWIETIISPVPLGTLFDIMGRSRAIHLDPDEFAALYGLFAPFVAEWSYPEPVGVEGLLARDMNVGLAVIYAWLDGVRSAPLPLPRRSSGTTPSGDQPA